MASTRSRRYAAQKAALLVALALTCTFAVLSAWLNVEGSKRPSTEGLPSSAAEDEEDSDAGVLSSSVAGDVPADEGSEPTCDLGKGESEDVGGLVSSELAARSLGEDVHSTVSEQSESGDMSDVARSVLGRYREDTCLLISSGYVDMMGAVWSCVIQGADWVDICVVKREEERVCTVRRVRLSPSGKEVRDAA